MLCTAFPTEKTDALFAMSTRLRKPRRLLQSGSLIMSAYLCSIPRMFYHARLDPPLNAAAADWVRKVRDTSNYAHALRTASMRHTESFTS